MHVKPKTAITAGRNLFTCNPDQFFQFEPPTDNIPTTGHLRIAATQLGYTFGQDGRWWSVKDSEGLSIVEGAPNERRALHNWWLRTGLEQVMKTRSEQQEWRAMAGPGRPSFQEEDEFEEESSSRTAMRTEAWMRLQSLWMDLRTTLINHAPITDIWLERSLDRGNPRPHSVRKVGERRTMVYAIHHLLDLDRLNQPLHDSLFGEKPDDAVIAEALGRDLPGLAPQCDMAALLPRMAMLAAVVDSPRSTEELFTDLRGILELHHVGLPSEVADLLRTVIT